MKLLAAMTVLLLTALLGGACITTNEAEPAFLKEPAPPFRHQSFYETLQQDAEHFNLRDGDWIEDYGDAAFFGLAFYSQAGTDEGNAGWLDKAEQARARALQLIDGADLLHGDLNEIVMSALGLIEHLDATSDHTDLPLLDLLLGRIDALVGALKFYLGPDNVDSWALDTYGPTTISALVALLNLQYAAVIGSGEQLASRIEWAQAAAQRIDEEAYNGSYYEFGAGRQGLFLYPNITMIITCARLYQLTGNGFYRDRALAIYQAIQALKVVDGDTGAVRYHSPYSAELMGAPDEDYSTLSSQNYLMLALMLLYEITGRATYVSETDAVLDTLEDLLYGEWCLSQVHKTACEPACEPAQVCVVDSCAEDECHGGVLHHWMSSGPAAPTDPEYFCSGCNLQLLYLMWYRQAHL